MTEDNDKNAARDDDRLLSQADASMLDEDESLAGAVMPLTEHLEELRSRIIRVLLALVALFIVGWIFRDLVMFVATLPHARVMQTLGMPDELAMIRYQEGFFAHVLVSLAAAALLAGPYIIYQAWVFIASGLLPKERKYIRRLIPVFILLFAAGALFGYFFALPVGLRFFVRMSGRAVRPVITLSSYLSTFLWLTLLFGLAFELPAGVYAVCRIGLASGEQLRKGRKYAVLGMFIGAALVTPPDPFTMAALALPLIVLYEVGIFIGEPNRANLRNAALALMAALAIPAAAYGWSSARSARSANVVEGEVVIERGERVSVVAPGGYIRAGAQLSVPDDIIATLRLGGNATAKIDGGSRVSIIAADALALQTGRMFAAATRGGLLSVSTDQADFVLRGGEGVFEADAQRAKAACLSGELEFRAAGREGVIPPGRQREFLPEDDEVDPERILDWLRTDD